ncbi:uncharacterized protein A1O5_07809 [Cladophialophora psammophila CBS 110553]|uniref:Uncharacterized protein n=1 Tax=Cladophialophora psammophila CBS 110553 TaxID=1182543 RepID=W9WL65_9EURO|nr:uncharacterized protein A1O5_07809 [Cladophialophora psammophila CBS 110553]EXJ68877.1 hypothetical protein A1O5_07809 [Cladophialophora psammophila CBS 110553]
MWRYGDAFGEIDGMRVIQAGIVDDIDVIDNIQGENEFFVPKRATWINALDGVRQIMECLCVLRRTLAGERFGWCGDLHC